MIIKIIHFIIYRILISACNFMCLALLKRQGLNVRGLLKAETPKEEPQPYIDCTGNLQVTCWLWMFVKYCFAESPSYMVCILECFHVRNKECQEKQIQ